MIYDKYTSPKSRIPHSLIEEGFTTSLSSLQVIRDLPFQAILITIGASPARGILRGDVDERATVQNIQISKEEAKKWMEEIGADRFITKNPLSSNAVSEHSFKAGIRSSENAKNNRALHSSDVVMSF